MLELEVVTISLGLLTIAVMIISYYARRNDVLYGGFIEKCDEASTLLSQTSPEIQNRLAELYRQLSISTGQAPTALDKRIQSGEDRGLQGYVSKFGQLNLSGRPSRTSFGRKAAA
jgi:hypothetical protein